ncbi:DUF2314 domain-containing protein [Stakelama tenebrarum]|uniref:DUF2314 domain-containing protein n=1 Tax=Stakelama tenebrarum TaxID=2711215 RepID=A0A6G6Y9G0_9SPHN|nr:DUF2314 domain-containing protein [Sphingosinithalassobacter tenebrarum]QIG81481.1 DUF2314 domain-containing protein [Sphingosinithalassobacter tenebrarum]
MATARLALILACASVAGAIAPSPALAQSTVRYIGAEDPAMNAAEQRAISELDAFFRHLAVPAADETEFMIKFDLSRGGADGDVEFIWGLVRQRSGTRTEVTLANEPVNPDYVVGQVVTVEDRWIDDWSYWKGDTLQGAYTVRVLLDQMPREQAAALRRDYGW